LSTANQIFSAGVQILLLWLSVSAHEAAHAWVAWLRGDETARLAGRLSLNPLRHIDFMGSILFPAVLVSLGLPVFGWGRPAPIKVENLRRPGRDDLDVFAAGPAANIVLAVVATVALAVAAHVTRSGNTAAAILIDQTAADAPGIPLLFTLVQMALLNAFLAGFHLIPVPPLDGGQIALRLLPPRWAARLAGLRLPGLMIGMALGIVPLLLGLLAFRVGLLGLVVGHS
jgi:Zn-dependent protease